MKRKEGEKSENVTRRSTTSSIPYVVNTYVCVCIYLCARNARSIRSSFSTIREDDDDDDDDYDD